jgi:predicted O-linked N-acetylglucosamine transferase (SPINDLY family)
VKRELNRLPMPGLTIAQALATALEHHRAGRFGEAEALYRQVLAVQPNEQNALHFLGVLAHTAGHHEDAVDWIHRSIAVDPSNPSAHSNLGEACFALGRVEEAIAHYLRALELDPQFTIPRFNLANARRWQGRLDEAEAGYRQVLDCDSQDATVHCNLAGTLAMQGRIDEGIAAFREALRLRPQDHAIHSSLIALLRYYTGADERAMTEEQQRWNRQFADLLLPFVQPHANRREPNRRLRIGYVSPDFLVHATLFFLAPLFQEHDRSHFEIHAYASVGRPDAGTELLRSHADAWHDVRRLSDDELADKIRADEIDILVDLSMHTAGNRLLLFACKPAPVQVAWLAYAGSTGLKAMDYRITDRYLDPTISIDPNAAEKPMVLPDSWCCYRPLGNEEPVKALPALSTGCITFGCLNNFFKFNDETLVRFSEVLRAVEKSRLVLLAPEGSARQRLTERFSECGIAADRLDYVSTEPRQNYLQRYHRIDIALDTLPGNGMATTCEALWMGVPVVSQVGHTAVSRAGLSLLSTIGLPELAARNAEEFLETAKRLAGDLPRLADLRATMRSRMASSPLMDAPRFARHMEGAYREMWRRWCADAG